MADVSVRDSATRALRRAIPLIPDNSDDAILLAEALWTSAIVTYARCFGSGRRTRLADDALAAATAQQLELHKKVIEQRNTHLAHVLSKLERSEVFLATAPDGVRHSLVDVVLVRADHCSVLGDIVV